MKMFDELEEKARELAAKARAAMDNPDEFLSKARERVEEAAQEARDEVRDFAADPKGEFKKFREQVTDLFDCDATEPTEPAVAEAEATAAAEPPPAAESQTQP